MYSSSSDVQVTDDSSDEKIQLLEQVQRSSGSERRSSSTASSSSSLLDALTEDLRAGDEFAKQLDRLNNSQERLNFLKAHKGVDLTNGGRVCLSKALLSSIENDTSGFHVYAKYFDPLTLVAADSNLSCMKRRRKMSFRVRASMYGHRTSKEPAFFSFANHADVNRLAQLFDLDIVVYSVKSTTDFSDFFEIAHDFRIFTAAQRGTSAAAAERNRRRIVSYVLTLKGQLYRYPPSWGLDICLSSWPFHLNREIGFFYGKCMAHSIAHLYGLPPPPVTCENYIQLQEHSSILYEYWQKKISLLVVAYCRNKIQKASSTRAFGRRRLFSNCHYSTLAFIGESHDAKASELSRHVTDETFKIVCFFADNRAGEVCPEHSTALLARYSNALQTDKIADADYQAIPRVTLEQTRAALALQRAKKRQQKEKIKEWKGSKICNCSICSKPDFQYNMNRGGPERLCTVQLDITDLLEMLGADSPTNRDIVARMSELSVAAMDIESMTVGLDFEQPDLNMPSYASIDSATLGGYSKQLQKPIMISHLDALSYEELSNRKTTEIDDYDDDDAVDPLTETARGDEEQEIYQMMERYWKLVLKRQECATAEKRRIAKPIFDMIAQYSQAHHQFFMLWFNSHETDGGPGGRDEGPGEMEPTWYQSVPGKLEKALNNLINDYQIFSFYGAGYDHILLESYLVPYLFEKKYLPKMEKRGNRVTLIKTKQGIVFRDVCKLLAPSTNLRNFGKLFGLEQEKAHFPFNLLDSVAALDIAELPDDPKLWASSLTGSPPIGPEEIAQAQALFRKANCKNLGDYLRAYLKLDVVILYKATQLWRSHLKTLVGIDFVESRKFTISSLSNLAGGKSLMHRRQVGNFFPNNSQIYRLLRQGMRGGLCSIYRPKAGRFSDESSKTADPDEEYFNNSHWLNRPSDLGPFHDPATEYVAQPSNHVLYYDATSLYPSSELTDMPVGTGTLYVVNPDHPHLLVKERRALNCTERFEAQVVQYLALHGHRRWTRRYGESPARVISSIHAGPGQQTFGSSKNQRCDLLLCFKRDPSAWTLPKNFRGTLWKSNAALLFYHNFHGKYFHYSGHATTCPDFLCKHPSAREHLIVDAETSRHDEFRKGYAMAMTMVRPSECVFQYSVSLECDYFHGGVVHHREVDLTRRDRRPVPTSTDRTLGWNDWIEGVGRISVAAKNGVATLDAEQLDSSTAEFESSDSSNDGRALPPDLYRNSLAELLTELASHGSVLASEQIDKINVLLKSSKTYLSKSELVEGVRTGRLTGFVTLTGGSEEPNCILGESAMWSPYHGDAQDRFGFCVQSYRPDPRKHEISELTRRQIAEFHDWNYEQETGRRLVDEYLLKQQARTLNSTTFHSEETISTSYLQWLIKERGFHDFTITHFIHYIFSDPSRSFLEPILQTRHECKQRGESVAAECLKLIVNGSYGYNGLEAINYDETKLMTDERLKKVRGTLMAHLTLKHITMLGIIRRKEKRRQKRQPRDVRGCKKNSFAFTEAEEVDDEGEEENEEEIDKIVQKKRQRKISQNESDYEILHTLESVDGSSSDDHMEESPASNSTSDSERREDPKGDLEELAVQRGEEHSYAMCTQLPTDGRRRKKVTFNIRRDQRRQGDRYRYHFLYAVTVSGADKKIKNSLQRAVAVLSNSKRLFFGHIRVMLECLHPGMAELCYIDTDSVLFSTTHADIESCLRPDKLAMWQTADILADESSVTSCHGKMKKEGVFAAGKFRALKVYRLYETASEAFEEECSEENRSRAACNVRAVYTRCKGVNRWLATQLPEDAFDPDFSIRLTVHRTCLRPTRTGEMIVAHEARTMTAPFNLKRLVVAPQLAQNEAVDSNVAAATDVRSRVLAVSDQIVNVMTFAPPTETAKLLARSYHTYPISFAAHPDLEDTSSSASSSPPPPPPARTTIHKVNVNAVRGGAKKQSQKVKKQQVQQSDVVSCGSRRSHQQQQQWT